MMNLVRIHWDYIRRPTTVLDKHIRTWPAGLGLGVWCVFSLASLSDVQVFNLQFDMLSYFLGGISLFGFYMWHLATLGLGLAVIWYVYPVIVRWIGAIPKSQFDPYHYRRLALYSPLAYVILKVFAVLPLRIFGSIFGMLGEVGLIETVILVLIVVAQGIIALWGMVVLVMLFVIKWKGLARYYGMSGPRIFVVMFVIPFATSIPIMILFGPRLLDFMINYVRAQMG